jgi:hypothetical protein
MKLFIIHKQLMKLLMFHVVIINFYFCPFWVLVHSSGKMSVLFFEVFMFSQRIDIFNLKEFLN